MAINHSHAKIPNRLAVVKMHEDIPEFVDVDIRRFA